jgi:putative FmdB family regulatory protein
MPPMPVYEFLCEDCNRVFNFLARGPATAKRRPKCPKCGGRKMSKLFSPFAMSRGGKRDAEPKSAEPAGDSPDAPTPEQEARAERALDSIERDMGDVDESNPRQMGALLRRLSEATGEPMDGQTDEMIRRLEAGEDVEKIEEEMADAVGDEEGAGGPGAPSHDEGLYDL